MATWVRLAEREAADIELPEYRADRLREVLSQVRSLSAGIVIAGAVHRARAVLASAGVGVHLSEGIHGAPASGALWWIRENPWIFLTLRYRTDDQLWFSLFHEIGHLLESGRRREVIEEIAGDSTTQAEQAADAFAREVLLPESELWKWLDQRNLDRDTIREFAAMQRVSPGIVVGRLQRDGVIRRNQFNDLKRPVPAAS